MALAPKRYCTFPGCGVLVTKGRCPAHRGNAERKSNHDQGCKNDSAWKRLRLAKLAANPYRKSKGRPIGRPPELHTSSASGSPVSGESSMTTIALSTICGSKCGIELQRFSWGLNFGKFLRSWPGWADPITVDRPKERVVSLSVLLQCSTGCNGSFRRSPRGRFSENRPTGARSARGYAHPCAGACQQTA
jgi:hypothetical protein